MEIICEQFVQTNLIFNTMNKLNKILIFILAPFVYGVDYIKGSLTVYYNHFFTKKEIIFKPFWIETNQIFEPVETQEEFKEICKRFKKAYPHVDIFDLKISKHDYNATSMAPISNTSLCSFGLRSEHIHDFDYTLRNWFNDDIED